MYIKVVFFLFFFSCPCYGQILDQLGNNKDDESPVIIDAEQSVVYDETAHKCVATGLARAQKGTSTVYGDVLTVYFTEDQDITTMTADGHVRMETPTETVYGDHAHYDVALDRVLMTGKNLKIVTQKEVLTARDSLEYWHTQHKGIARGNAIVRFLEREQLVQADSLVAYFTLPLPQEGEEKKTEIDHIDAIGHVLASGPNGIVTGDKGVYFGKTEEIEIFNNVKITQGKNVITGEYGRANLKTNVAELFSRVPNTSCSCPPKRISGIIIPKDVNERKKKKLGF